MEGEVEAREIPRLNKISESFLLLLVFFLVLSLLSCNKNRERKYCRCLVEGTAIVVEQREKEGLIDSF